MKTLNEKHICAKALITGTLVTLSAVPAFAVSFVSVVEPIVELLNSFIGPLMAIVGAVGSLYCILLGVKYAKAEEPQDREKAKQHLKSAIIGFVLIFVLIVVLNLMMEPMMAWVTEATNSSVTFSGTATN